MNKKIKASVAEIQALCENIRELDQRFSKRGFYMPSDTKLRLSNADDLIARADSLEDEDDEQQWLTEADALCVALRAEAGVVVQNAQSGATPAGE